MKKITLLFFIVFLAFVRAGFSQTPPVSTLFYENFDDPNNIQMTDSSTSGLNSWAQHYVYASAPYSDSGKVMYKDTIYLTTPIIDITGKKSVSIEFDHVAKVHNLDMAKVQISLDSQKTWITLTTVEHQSGSVLQKAHISEPYAYLFSENSGIALNNIWKFPIGGNNPQMVTWQPVNSNDFVHEIFEISNRLNTTTNNLSVRFALGDDINRDNNALNPNGGRAGWWVDNVEVRGAECLLIAPQIKVNPPNNYINQYIGSVYWEGPYDFTAEVTDGEGVDEVLLIYSINGGPEQTKTFANLFGATYYVEIPKIEVSIGDTVCWRVEAYDVTACRNKQIYPNATIGCFEFEVRQNLPKGCGTTPVNQYPYAEDFNVPVCVIGNTATLCQNWTNATGDFGDWNVHFGATPTVGTGPIDDFPGGGKYLYINSENHTNNISNLKSPCLDFYEIENPNVRFYVNTYGQSTGQLHVDLLTFDGPTVLDVIPPIPTTSTPGWQKVEFNLFQYKNKIVQLRFRGKTGFNKLSDIAIDSVSIFNSPLIDLNAVSVTVDQFAPAGTKDSVTIAVRNLGVYPVDSMHIYLSYDGQAFGPAVGSNVFVGPSETKTFKVKANQFVPLRDYTIQAVVKLVDRSTGLEGDGRLANDTTQVSSGYGLPTIDLVTKDEYYDSFEDTANHLWTPYPFGTFNTNNWMHGYPNYGQTSGVFHGEFAWDINLIRPNTNREETAFLISPFMDLSNSTNLVFQFMQNRNLDIEDLFFVQFSRDRGKTWEKIPGQPIPGIDKHWANANVLLPTNEIMPGWNNTSSTYGAKNGIENKWKMSEKDISALADVSLGRVDEILLRFGFYDKSVPPTIPFGPDGVTVDAVRIIDMRTHDAAPIEIITPFSHCLLSNAEPVEFKIQNFGLSNLISTDVKVNVYKDGTSAPIQSFTENIPNLDLLPRDTAVVKLNGTVNLNDVRQWYTVEIITEYTLDQNIYNDTIRRRIENIEGCFLRLSLAGPGQHRATFMEGAHHQFYVNGRIPEYPSYMHYRDGYKAVSTFCARDSSTVTFELYDPFPPPTPANGNVDERNIVMYSMVNDLEPKIKIIDRTNTPLVRMPGGTQTKTFVMDCPPIRSVSMSDSDLRLVDKDILPTAREYNFELTWQSLGIDSISYVELQLWVDENLYKTDTLRLPGSSAVFYRETYSHLFDRVYIGPGEHVVTVISTKANEKFDYAPWDDTARMTLRVVDTSYTNISKDGYFTSFETDGRPQWVSLNPYTYTTNSLFEKGKPTKTIINKAFDGNKAWVTDLKKNFRPFDSSSVVSPYFFFEKEVCYQIGFQHIYAFRDFQQDGGNFQYSVDTGRTWVTITEPYGGDSSFQNWNNVYNIASIPNNSLQNPNDLGSYYNSGWSGISDSLGNYTESKAKLGFYGDQYVVFRFNFESDGPPNDEGWAVDYFSIDTLPASSCFTVGIEELFAKHSFFLGNNKPNPFNDQSLIPVYLPKSGELIVEVLNMMGQPIYQSREVMSQGDHLIPIRNDSWASGVYYYSVIFDGERQTKKMMITK